ncbi:MAG: DUF72 domain-containing protein [Armatimonadetes bacterium]|nr:DUF72 domain-containing protein [Armatimonadota bacterium]MDW8121906.1 DUF72 domain-containing protein [Armatimonadota bacterium]
MTLKNDMSQVRQQRVLIGCCGFPVKRSQYYRQFPVVEIQQTFYQPPQKETVKRWRVEAPDDFLFTVKAWQLITHPPTSPTYRRLKKPLSDKEKREAGHLQLTDTVLRAWDETVAIAQILRSPIILIQTPSSFRPQQENLDRLRKLIPILQQSRMVIAWEPRGDWSADQIEALCRELHLLPAGDPFGPYRSPLLSTPTRYFRLHGITGYRYRFTDSDLSQLSSWFHNASTVYCLFNNVGMWEDATKMRERLGLQGNAIRR